MQDLSSKQFITPNIMSRCHQEQKDDDIGHPNKKCKKSKIKPWLIKEAKYIQKAHKEVKSNNTGPKLDLNA